MCNDASNLKAVFSSLVSPAPPPPPPPPVVTVNSRLITSDYYFCFLLLMSGCVIIYIHIYIARMSMLCSVCTVVPFSNWVVQDTCPPCHYITHTHTPLPTPIHTLNHSLLSGTSHVNSVVAPVLGHNNTIP